MKKQILIITTFFFLIQNLSSQGIIAGRIYDKIEQSPLENVEVFLPDQSQGTITESDGGFRLYSETNSGSMVISMLGYSDQSIYYEIIEGHLDIGKIFLSPIMVELNQLIVSADITDERTPVSFSTIDQETIENISFDQPLPRVMESVPGIFAVRNGGGSGDAELKLRGFDQENITVLLDGIPVNGIENGLIYWSNYIGLATSIGEIQIQKGIGASVLGINSVGGTINIIPDFIQAKRKNAVSFSTTNYGNFFITTTLQSKFKPEGWNVKFVGSRTWGNGFADETYVNGWSYFLNIKKQINKKNFDYPFSYQYPSATAIVSLSNSLSPKYLRLSL